MNTSTPETDAFCMEHYEDVNPTMLAGFARTLEQQRDEARKLNEQGTATIHRWQQLIADLESEVATLEQQRDEARKTCAELMTDSNTITSCERNDKL